MRAMWLGFAVAIVIAVLAGAVMTRFDDSAGRQFSSSSTRL